MASVAGERHTAEEELEAELRRAAEARAEGRMGECERRATEVKGQAQARGAIGLVGDACEELAYLAEARGDREGAQELVLEAYEINRDARDFARLAGNYSLLGWLASARGEFEDAELLHGYAKDLNGQLVRPEAQAVDEQNLGNVYRLQERFAEAEERLLAAIELHVSKEARAGALHDLALLYLSWARRGEAEAALQEVVVETQGNDASIVRALAQMRLGDLASERGDLSTAQREYDEASRIFGSLERPLHAGGAKEKRADAAERLGDTDETERSLTEALVEYEKTSEHRSVGRVCGRLARFAMKGSATSAAEWFQRSMAAYQRAGEEEGEAQARVGAGCCAAEAGKIADATYQWLEAQTIYRRLGMEERVAEVEALRRAPARK